MNDRAERDRLIFNQIAAKYARKDLVQSSALPRKAQLMTAVAPLLSRDCGMGVVVDIGCGVGAPATFLSGHYERYVGIDQSEEMIRVAQAFNQAEERAEFLTGSAAERLLPENTADVVLSVGALHHMTELDRVFSGLRKVARPGAALVVIEPQCANPLIQFLRCIRKLIDKSYSKEQHFFTEEELRNLLERHGILDVTVVYQGYVSSPFAQVILPPQFLTVPLSRLATSLDQFLVGRMPGTLRKLSFNIIMRGVFSG